MTDTSPAIARISRISFLTDMTRADAPIIPLGYMFEAVWPKKARWLGLIGRLRLTPPELERVNMATWSELKEPFKLMTNLFFQGWAAPWATAGEVIQHEYHRSALSIGIGDRSASLIDRRIDSAAAWATTNNCLLVELAAFQSQLVPVIQATVVTAPRPKQAPAAPAPAISVAPTGSQIMTDSPEALAA
jgi:hypothetical protein